MYCRECHYDLRGQREPRCPECGCVFDPHDEKSYLPQVPTGLQTVLANDGRKRFAELFAVALLYGAPLVFFVPIISVRGHPLRARDMSRILLNSIVQAHIGNADLSPEDGTLAVDEIRHDLAPSRYSRAVARQHDSAIRWNRQATHVLKWCVFAVGPALVVAVLTRRWLRRLAIIIASICALGVLFSLIIMFVVGGVMRASSYAYVNDYVLVPSVDWRDYASSSWNKIVAFEKNPWPGAWRVVARNLFEVRVLREAEFQGLLSEQPVARRAWDDCIASGQCTKVSE